MIKAVIVEDELKNISVLKKLLAELCPTVDITGVAENAEIAYTKIQELRPDLIFLDIEMPYGNGFDLLERFNPISFEVIFITAYSQYALKAFKYNSIDYLLKPIDENELVQAVARAEKRIESSSINANLQEFIRGIKLYTPVKIGLPTQEGFVFINPESIIRCEADGAYSNIHYGDGKKLMVSKNLRELESLLSDAIFCRVHHSYIVNLNRVKKYLRGKGGEIEMEDGSLIPVSVRKKSDFLNHYNLINQRH